MSRRRVARSCRACGAPAATRYGVPDPCLGCLPGVRAACCGHGYAGLCYIAPAGNGPVLRGEDAYAALVALGGSPAPLAHEGHPAKGGALPGWETA